MSDLQPPPQEWLPRWLARLRLAEPLPPRADTLERITRAHLAEIPFENLTVLNRKVPEIDLGSLTRKLIDQHRGGYCFELNTSLWFGLKALGFDARLRMARVMLNRDVPGPRTHCVVIITLDGTDWLADVGFGGPGPSAPLRLQTEAPVILDDVRFRFEHRENLGTVLSRQSREAGWSDIYAFTDELTAKSDLDAGNWLAATMPGSLFQRSLVVACQADGKRHTIEGTTFCSFKGQELAQETDLPDLVAVLACLQDVFGITADMQITEAVARALSLQQ
jgi:N-hydroxyarylamine O-acetyltransferase